MDVGNRLTQVLEGGRQQKRIMDMQKLAPEVIKSGDPGKIAEFMIEYPEMANVTGKVLGTKNELVKQKVVDLAKNVLMENADPVSSIAAYAEILKQNNEDPKLAVQSLQKALASPDHGKKWAENMLAFSAPEEYKAYKYSYGENSGSSTDLGTFVEYEAQRIRQEEGREPTPRELQEAGLRFKRAQVDEVLATTSAKRTTEKETDLRYNPAIRAAETSAQLGVEGQMRPGIEGNVTQAKTHAELKAKTELEPGLESAIDTAKSEAAYIATNKTEKKGNDKAWNVYNGAMENLSTSLGGTTTGPFVGLIPSITTNQQIAEGAVAVMAPVLKQMFRSAGEGIFTDKDQELLMKMVPTRKDLPEAREAKIKAIDLVVRAKLGKQESSLPDGVSESDISDKMKKYGIDREEVIKRYKKQPGVK